MEKIKNIISSLKSNWSYPKTALHRGEPTLFQLSCQFNEEGIVVGNDFPVRIPNDLSFFWTISSGGELFKDIEYGQWGLQIYTPQIAITKTLHEREGRGFEYSARDLIIGSFFGDSDLLLIHCEENNEFNYVAIVKALDGRNEWPIIAPTFTEFLDRYAFEQGDKFWE